MNVGDRVKPSRRGMAAGEGFQSNWEGTVEEISGDCCTVLWDNGTEAEGKFKYKFDVVPQTPTSVTLVAKGFLLGLGNKTKLIKYAALEEIPRKTHSLSFTADQYTKIVKGWANWLNNYEEIA